MNYPMLDDGTRDWCRTCTHIVNGACELMLDCTYQSDENGIDYDKAPTKYKEKSITNADRIRAMSDEELAEFLLNRDVNIVEKASKAVGFTYKVDREQCLVKVIGWLKEEVVSDG